MKNKKLQFFTILLLTFAGAHVVNAADNDGNGVEDSSDAFPLDSTKSLAPRLSNISDGKVLDAEKNNQVKRQSRPKSKRSAFSNSGSESDPPVLNGVEIDKVSIDVSAGPQTVTFTLDVSDESVIDWIFSCICLTGPSGKFIPLRSTDADGVFTYGFSSSDPSGTYRIGTIWLYDTVGNLKVYDQSEIELLTGPSFVYLLGLGEEATNLTLTSESGVKSVAKNSELNYSLTVENLASIPSGQLSFELKSTNVRVNAVSQAGSPACSISSISYNSTVSCVLSGVDANTSKVLNLTLAPGIFGTASFNASIVADIPDITYLNNYVSV